MKRMEPLQCNSSLPRRFAKKSLDRMVADGRFPKPMKLTERRMAYNAKDVEAWMAQQVESA